MYIRPLMQSQNITWPTAPKRMQTRESSNFLSQDVKVLVETYNNQKKILEPEWIKNVRTLREYAPSGRNFRIKGCYFNWRESFEILYK